MEFKTLFFTWSYISWYSFSFTLVWPHSEFILSSFIQSIISLIFDVSLAFSVGFGVSISEFEFVVKSLKIIQFLYISL